MPSKNSQQKKPSATIIPSGTNTMPITRSYNQTTVNFSSGLMSDHSCINIEVVINEDTLNMDTATLVALAKEKISNQIALKLPLEVQSIQETNYRV